MVHFRHLITGLALLLCFATPRLDAQEASAPAIDPLAEQIIHEWAEHESDIQSYRIEIDDVSDVIEDWGQKVTHLHRRTLTVTRPNMMRLETRGDTTNRDVVYDGSTVTLYDLDECLYAQVEFSGTNQQMIDAMLNQYGVYTPLADFLTTDRAAILDNVETGHHLGMSQVGDHVCHHLAFTEETIDWQAWIELGERPVMRRLIVTDKRVPSQPQCMLTLVSSSIEEEIPQEVFTFEPPIDAEMIELVPLDDMEAQETPESQPDSE